MASEIRIIKLDRKSLKKGASEQHINKNDSQQIQTFFATDYFDSLSVTQKRLDTPLVSFMNYTGEEKNTEEETSTQSYTLYYSENMKKKYECNSPSEIHKDNPFETSYAELPYLSIIQVHIIPEVFRCITYGDNELWKENSIILEPFLDDLYDVIEQYGKNKDKKDFIYRIYQVLSAGDLAVVIKSKCPTIPFEISSLIRARKAKTPDNALQLVLYKTYTLFAIEPEANLSPGNEKNDKTKVVIRGCYSCEYWHEQTVQQTENVPILSKPNEMFGLNGRYDFSIDLTIEEFAQFYPTIREYKGLALSKNHSDTSSNLPYKVAYLVELLNKGYLSYINERYLLNDTNVELKPEHCVTRYIQLDNECSHWNTLYEKNNIYIEHLMQKFISIEAETIQLRDAHKNLEQYFKLIKRLILSCKSINQVSDTSIYVQEIGTQLEIALDSIKIYREIIIAEKNIPMIDIMVDNIKNVVHMIDCYIAYIRNNNLQSLQMPNYNIESSMSMEKILIGYNECLKHFIANCQKLGPDGSAEHQKEYFPIIIPDLHYMDISVQVLFAEGFSRHWKKEQEKRDKQRFLMIVESPTLEELGDIPVFMALLFHEMAHQFRYKERQSRNACLLDMLVGTYAAQIASNIALEVCQTLSCEEASQNLYNILKGGFKTAILLEIKDYLDKDENSADWQAPLIYFKNAISELLKDFTLSWQNQTKMENTMKYFIRALQKNGNISKEPQFMYIANAEKLIHHESEENTVQTVKKRNEICKKLIKYAFAIAGLSVYDAVGTDTIKEMDWLLQADKVEKWVSESEKDEKTSYNQLWDKLKLQSNNEESATKISWVEAAFNNMVNCILAPTEEKPKNNFKCQKKILESAYATACSEWKKAEKVYADYILETNTENADKLKTAEIYRSWSLIGRYLGLDYPMKENCTKFTKMLQKDWVVSFDSEKLLQRIDIYREVTADMFMYILMDMTPFTYLNLAASIIPHGNLTGANLDRVITVLYIMSEKSSKDENQEDEMETYRKTIISAWHEFIAYCENMLGQDRADKSGHFTEIFSEFELFINMYEEKKAYHGWKTLKVKIVEAAQHNIDDKQMILIHIKKVCELLHSISKEEKNCINALEEEKVIKADYISGKGCWTSLRDELSNQPDNIVKEVLTLSKKNQDFLKNQHYKTGVVNNAELNEAGIKFLLRSYYSQKINASGERKNHEN